MPVPLGDPLFTPNMNRGSDTGTQENPYSQPTALHRQRTASNTTVPGIDVVTPVSLKPIHHPRNEKYSFPRRPIPPVQTYLNELSLIPSFLPLRVRTEPRFQNTPYMLLSKIPVSGLRSPQLLLHIHAPVGPLPITLQEVLIP